MFIAAKNQVTRGAHKFSGHVSQALVIVADSSKKLPFASACIEVGQRGRRRIGKAIEKIPVPAVIRNNVSKADAAFLATAYAIPLPGTGPGAVVIIGCKIGYRLLRQRLNRRRANGIGNG